MANYGGRLVNTAVDAEYVAELTVADAAARDAAVAAGSAGVGVVIRQRDSGARDLVLTTTPTYQALAPLDQRVADQAARAALSPVEGETVYQVDIKVTYQWRSDDGGAARWRIIHMPAIDDVVTSGFASIVYYLDLLGNDDNDGRGAGASRAKRTMAAIFADLNEAGGVPFGFVQIIPSAGVYAEDGFGQHVLHAAIPGGVFVIPAMDSFANNEDLTVITDDGLTGGSPVERNLTVTAFTSFAGRGDRFAWVPDGFSPTGDNFPTLGQGAIRPSTTPNLRICASSAPVLTAFKLSQFEFVLQTVDLRATDSETQIYFYGSEIQFSSASLPTIQNIRFIGSSVKTTGGPSTMLLRKNFTKSLFWAGNHFQFPANVNIDLIGQLLGMNGCDLESSNWKVFAGSFAVNGNVSDGVITWGGFSNSEGIALSGQVSGDFRTSGIPFLLYGRANVRSTSDIYAPNCLTSVFSVNEFARYSRQLGDIIAANPALAGPAVLVRSNGAALGLAGVTGIVTNPVGQDVKIGANAVIALAALPNNDFAAGATSEGCRAT